MPSFKVTYSGHMTYYNAGLGSCDYKNVAHPIPSLHFPSRWWVTARIRMSILYVECYHDHIRRSNAYPSCCRHLWGGARMNILKRRSRCLLLWRLMVMGEESSIMFSGIGIRVGNTWWEPFGNSLGDLFSCFTPLLLGHLVVSRIVIPSFEDFQLYFKCWFGCYGSPKRPAFHIHFYIWTSLYILKHGFQT